MARRMERGASLRQHGACQHGGASCPCFVGDLTVPTKNKQDALAALWGRAWQGTDIRNPAPPIRCWHYAGASLPACAMLQESSSCFAVQKQPVELMSLCCPNWGTDHSPFTLCCFHCSSDHPTPRFSPHACQSLAVSQESTQDCKCRRTSNRICSSSARIAYCLARGDSQQVSPPRLHSIHILYYTLIICCGLWKADGGLN